MQAGEHGEWALGLPSEAMEVEEAGILLESVTQEAEL